MDIKEKLTDEYIEYIEEHRLNVWKAYNVIKSIFKEEIAKFGIGKELASRCLNHDISKFTDKEFEYYRINYYPIDKKEKELNKKNYEEAWKHHYIVNDHHWNHWVNGDGSVRDMTMAALFEMLADWTAMGYVFGNTAYEYYSQNKKKIQLHPDTAKLVEQYTKKLHDATQK